MPEYELGDSPTRAKGRESVVHQTTGAGTRGKDSSNMRAEAASGSSADFARTDKPYRAAARSGQMWKTAASDLGCGRSSWVALKRSMEADHDDSYGFTPLEGRDK
jgi:hypothetical protein